MKQIDPAYFAEAMARMPGPISLITTGAGADRKGLVASAVCSLSMDPPSLIVCVNKQASAHDSLVANGRFGVNILADRHKDLIRTLSSKAADRFAEGQWCSAAENTPLLQDAAVAAACDLVAVHDGFSHSILVGRITDLRIHETPTEETMLVWLNRAYKAVG